MEGTPSKDGEAAETETPKLQRKRGSNKELRLLLVRTEMEDTNQGGPTRESTKPDMATGARRSLRPKTTRGADVKYPKETRIRVVGGEIVDSPVAESSAGTPMGDIVPAKKKGTIDLTAVTSDTGDSVPISRGTMESMSMTETENTESSFEEIPRKGKKRGRKPKGSNATGSRALSKISSKRMEFEDDEWDREDFFQISKKTGHGMKKRKGLVECQLDDRLSSKQKDAIEEVTELFPQMSPKSIMVETLRVLDMAGEAERRTQTMKGDLRRQMKVGVNVAKIAIQRLASDIVKSAGPVDEVRSINLALEREVLKLRREMDILRREKTALKDQVETLTRTVQGLREKEERGRPGRERVSPSQLEEEVADEFPASRTRKKKNQEPVQTETNETSEAPLPPVYRPMLGGVQKRMEERPKVRTSVDVTGRIVTSASERTHEEQRSRSRAVRAGETHRRDISLSPARDYLVEGEPWTKAKSKKALKRARRKERGKTASETDGRREAASERAARPSRDKNLNRTAKAAAGEVPEGRTGAVTRTARKIPVRPAGRDPRFRAHRTAAVLLRCEEAGGNSAPTYADVMRMARDKISLEELEISNTRIRKAQTGGLLIEIPSGEEAGAKAEALVDRLKTVIAESEFGKKVSVIRPVQRAEVRLIDVDQSATVEEVIAAVSECGKVPVTSIRAGPSRQGRGGLNTIWVQCPLSGANLLLSSGKLRVGWTMAKVVPLAKRRLQCFRCLAVGHTRTNCLRGC
ncbi:PREDICTED: uncharacterized protein LOC108770382 [Trachymyrmex cornetzi]|uniref:uncharacterized protein LOC108770382 n=1 Tax=Trachymyrmex cornetzi TaxID=471704 RepID=UPI00084EE019|nr:PREDICTED: uncharacterized protein LOC108770382 [Trachymyrmex cornetzi]